MQLFLSGLLLSGEERFNSFISKLHHPVVLVFEMLFIAAVLFHSFNGIRVILLNIGLYPDDSKAMSYTVLFVFVVLFLLHVLRALENFTVVIL
ncbi:hypothetical protein CHISP_0218 [Chitinispirillum alkaliphilum]|nr:hypothetical protein CHISP_0218 [Chitinispirillum alkaliphilum]